MSAGWQCCCAAVSLCSAAVLLCCCVFAAVFAAAVLSLLTCPVQSVRAVDEYDTVLAVVRPDLADELDRVRQSVLARHRVAGDGQLEVADAGGQLLGLVVAHGRG